MQPHAPQRRRPHFVRGNSVLVFRIILPRVFRESLAVVLHGGLHDSISRTHVVQQEISLWLKRLASQRRRDREVASIYRGSGSRGRKGRDVACSAAHVVKERFSLLRFRSLR